MHTILQECPRNRAARGGYSPLLKGLIHGRDGTAFSPSQTRKGGKLYRYFVSQTVLRHGLTPAR